MATYTRAFRIATDSSEPDGLLEPEWGCNYGKTIMGGLKVPVGRKEWPERLKDIQTALAAKSRAERLALLPLTLYRQHVEDLLIARGITPKPVPPDAISDTLTKALKKQIQQLEKALLGLPEAEQGAVWDLITAKTHGLEPWLLRVLCHKLDPAAVTLPATTRLTLDVQVTYQGDKMPTARQSTAYRDLALRLLAFFLPSSALAKALPLDEFHNIPLTLPFFVEVLLEDRTNTSGRLHVLAESSLLKGFSAGMGGDSTAW